MALYNEIFKHFYHKIWSKTCMVFGSFICWQLFNLYSLSKHLYLLLLSYVQLFLAPWNAACQAPLSMRFPRQEYWSGLSFPSPGDLPNPGIEPTSTVSPALQAGSLPVEPPGKPHMALKCTKRISVFNYITSSIVQKYRLTSSKKASI